MSLKAILDECNLTQANARPVHGGDINQAFSVTSGEQRFFLKLNDAEKYPQMFRKEASGLQALAKSAGNIGVPTVVKHGVVQQQQYLLLEWMDSGISIKNSWENFGTALAQMHRQPGPFFGWAEDNFIGSLIQKNTNHTDWHSFYSECRVKPLAKLLYDSGAFSKQEMNRVDDFCKNTADIFPEEPPALLHGDLWSGNFMFTPNGQAAFYDPAVYYGHREMDLGMTQLFGGFDHRFYEAYHSTYPLEKNWQKRVPLTQLYPLLVHAILFGGHYISSARNIIYQYS